MTESEHPGEPADPAATGESDREATHDGDGEPAEKRPSPLRIAFRVGLTLAAIGIAFFVLAQAFEDLDAAEIASALGNLSDAAWLALISGWLVWIGAQGLQTASLVTDLPARRGVVAWLGPNSVASVIPGPSDLPVRYAMYRTWGVGTIDAGTAVAMSGVFSIGSQLVLPALAGIVIVFGAATIDGVGTIIAATTLVLAAVLVVAAAVLGSAGRTERAGGLLDPLWRLAHRVFRRPPPERSLAPILVEQRARAIAYLRDKWVTTTFATVLTVAAKWSLLVMSLRFVGATESELSTAEIFVVYALVAGLTVVPITPGSAGVTEVALVAMLTSIGDASVNDIAAGTLLFRLMTWLVPIPVGFAVLARWRLVIRREAAADT